jgi:hypothetical protein
MEDTVMKRLHQIALLFAASALIVSGLAFAGDDAWFDMENCTMCKNLTKDPELIHHMTWQQLNISNGVIAITEVDAEYADSYASCSAGMAKVGEQAMQGKQMPLCNSCMAFGGLMMKGLESERVETMNGEIWLMTSDDPAVVKDLQKWAEKNMAEVAKMHPAEG